MTRATLSTSFLNVILVFIESTLTLLLRLDPELRRAAYPLAKQQTVVCLRLYLPHTEVYATFSSKGVLLDADLPAGRSEPDVIINAYSVQVINAMTTHDSATTDKLQFRGEAEQVTQVKQFIIQLGLGSLIQSLIKKVKGDKDKPAPDDTAQAQKVDSYQRRIKEQQTQINTLTIKNRELETTTKELESKQKMLMIGAIVAAVIAIISLVMVFID